MKNPRRISLWLAVAVLAALGGCATSGPISPPGPPPPRELAQRVVEDATAAPEASTALDAMPPVSSTPPPQRPLLEEPRFDVGVNQVPARDFFLNLVEGTAYDMVVHPGVGGSLSLSLQDASVAEILEAVRAVYGYGYRSTPTGFYVLPAEIRSRVFHVNYLHALRRGESELRVSTGELSQQANGGGTQTNAFGPTTTTGRSGGKVLESSRVRTESQANVWDELALSIQAIVGSGEDRSVVVSPQAGIVVVRAEPDELRQVEEYLDGVASNLQRQVILDARIIEVELGDGFRTGINWALLVESGAKSALFGQTGGGTLLDRGTSEIAGNSGILDPNSPSFPSNTDTSAFGGVFSAALDLGKLTAFIELLETQGDVHVLSSPRISSLNNQKAIIKVGQDEFFVTDVSTTTVTGTATTTSPDVTLTPFFSGIVLDVLPQISEEGDVILHVHPSISQVTDQTKTISVGTDEPLELPLALSTIRETDSIVRARSGQVVVIGGLMQDRGRYQRASIPLLGRIPWIGPHLFGQQEGNWSKSELVILLRPQVVGHETWRRDIERSRERLEDSRYSEESRRLLDDSAFRD